MPNTTICTWHFDPKKGSSCCERHPRLEQCRRHPTRNGALLVERRKQRDQRSNLPPPTCSTAQLARVLSPRAPESGSIWVADSSPLRHSLTEKFCADRASDKHHGRSRPLLLERAILRQAAAQATEPSPQLKQWRYSSALPSGARCAATCVVLAAARTRSRGPTKKRGCTLSATRRRSQPSAPPSCSSAQRPPHRARVRRDAVAAVFEDDARRISRQELLSLCVRRPQLNLKTFVARARPRNGPITSSLSAAMGRAGPQPGRVRARAPAFADGLMSLMGRATSSCGSARCRGTARRARCAATRCSPPSTTRRRARWRIWTRQRCRRFSSAVLRSSTRCATSTDGRHYLPTS